MGFRARVLMWGLFAGAAAAVLAPVGPGAFVPLKMAIASADSVGNDVYVAVVVDFGNGSSTPPVAKCVPVASNAHDSDALAAAVGSGNVAYSSSGLMCAIDSYPANGVQNCGQSVGSGNYDYWSYWHGSSGSWNYANNGPAGQSVASPANDVEGWRFQLNVPDNGTNPPPTVAPSYAQICNASTEVPPTQSPSAAVTTTTMSPATAPSVTPTTGKAGTGPASATTPSTAVSSRPGSSVPTTSAVPGRNTTTTTTALTPGVTSGSGGRHGSSGSRRLVTAGAASHAGGGSSSSSLLPVILVAVVVAALGGFALFRWRRRPAEE